MGGVARSLAVMFEAPAGGLRIAPIECALESLGVLQRSLVFAELSNLAYHARAEAGQLAFRMGFPEIRFYNRDGAQAYIFANEADAVVACRGTEPRDWNDVRADLRIGAVLAETAGWVHGGFKREVDDLWPRLEQALVTNTKTLWFTGHSLGGAMAAICAGRCQLSTIRSNPRGLYTFGSPRIGSRRYVNYVRMEAYRWVNNNDIVPRLPPAWLGYRHKGQEIYLNAYGHIRRLTGWQRVKDRWRGFRQGLHAGSFDHFADHAIARYIESIRRAVADEEGGYHATHTGGWSRGSAEPPEGRTDRSLPLDSSHEWRRAA
jgi:triacylglycerol lipase